MKLYLEIRLQVFERMMDGFANPIGLAGNHLQGVSGVLFLDCQIDCLADHRPTFRHIVSGSVRNA